MDASEVLRFEQGQERERERAQKVGTLKLSEAIRIGARLRPQCDGMLFMDGKSCALGAAYEGAFGFPMIYGGGADFTTIDKRDGWEIGTRLRWAFPFLNGPGMQEIWRRNDTGGMTREQIADWLASQGL